jgi:drug/metabolite transporter (DMT)-like permease
VLELNRSPCHLRVRRTYRHNAIGVALGAFAYTVWVASVTFAVWFALIVHYSTAALSVFPFLAPLFGVAAGHLVLNEPLTRAFAAAVLLVAAGPILVNRPR